MAHRTRPAADRVTCQHCGRLFRAITYLHLRNRHGYDGEHPVQEYKSHFRLAYAICRASRRKLSAAKDQYWKDRGCDWTREKLLVEIRRLHDAGRRLGKEEVPTRLYEAARRLFGSWEAAVEAAGLDYEEASGVRRWTPEKVVARIRQLAEQGVPLYATYVQEHYPYLLRAATKAFPTSWTKALVAAGIDPADHPAPRDGWTEDEARDWVRRRVARKQSVLARDVPADLLGFVYRHLNVGWADFVESLGVPYPGVKKRRDWSKKTLIEAIRQRDRAGKPMNYRAVADSEQALIHQARKYFPSWDRALAAARA
jgi:Homing endonuclease associated repeat